MSALDEVVIKCLTRTSSFSRLSSTLALLLHGATQMSHHPRHSQLLPSASAGLSWRCLALTGRAFLDDDMLCVALRRMQRYYCSRITKKRVIGVTVPVCILFLLYQLYSTMQLNRDLEQLSRHQESAADSQKSVGSGINVYKGTIQGNAFTCRSSGRQIPVSFVNDDYCDCEVMRPALLHLRCCSPTC